MAENEKVRLSRFPWWFWALMVGLFFVLVVAVGWFLQSPGFREIVLNRVVAELERATGGNVEMQSLTWNLSKLEVEAKGITIRGLEAPTDVPFAHVDRLYARVHIVSFFSPNIDLEQLTLDQPVIHVIVKPDGSTNVPEPRVKSNGNPLQQLFDLAIVKAEVHNGTLLLNEEKIPLDFKAYDVGIEMGYHILDKRYDGSVQVGKMDGQFPDLRDIPATANAEFSLWQNRAQVKSLKLTSQKSSLELSGTVDDFQHPKVKVDYAATVDLGQAGGIARVPELRGGGANITGSGTFAAENFSTSGKLTVRNVDFRHDSFGIRDASGGTEFSIDPERIVLKKIEARIVRGSVTGSAEVKHYAPSLEAGLTSTTAGQATKSANPSVKSGAANGKTGAVPVEQGSANLKLTGASLGELVHLLSSPSLPLDKLKAAGVVNGKVDVSWKESIKRAIVEIAADSVAPSQSEPDQLPTSATFRGRYNVGTGATEVTTMSLATPNTEISANGTIGSHSVQLHIAANTDNLKEFQPMFSAEGEPAFPLEIAGRASFNGTLAGKITHPDIVGRVLATDFSYVYTPTESPSPSPQPKSTLASILKIGAPSPPPSTQPTPRKIHIDSLAGDVQFGGDTLAFHNGVIEQGAARLNVDGSVQLHGGKFTDDSSLQLDASLRNAAISDLQQTVGTDYPVRGVLNLNLQANGTKSDLHGHGSVALTGGEAYGYAIKTATSDIVLANQSVQLQNIRLDALGGTVAGMAAYNLDTHQVNTELRGEKIDLAQIEQLQTATLQEHGIASFTLKSSGTLQQPVIDAHLHVVNLVFNDDYRGGDFQFDAVTQGDKLQVTGRSSFERAVVAIDGSVELKGDMQSDIKMQFSQLAIDPLLRSALKTQITKPSNLSGHAEISGPLRQPSSLRGSMTIDAFAVELEKIAIQTEGPVELSLADEVITMKRLTLASQDTNLSVGGTLDLKGERPLDVYAKGHFNLALFHALDDEITSYGTTDADVTVKGTMANPLMNGRVVIAHAGFSLIDLPAALGEVNGTMVFNENRLEVERLAGRVGGGQVSFSGFITYGNNVGFDLTTKGTDIRFRYAGVSVTADQTLRLSGTLKSSLLSGEITVTRFAQIPSVELSPAVFAQPVAVPNPNSPLNNLRLDVRIVSAPELTVQTALAKLSGDVDLRLRGTGRRPSLLGRINIAEGDINLNGTKYHLDRGDVTFANPLRIDPVLDVEATTRVRDFDITIGLHGTLDKLTTTYRSDPPLSSDDIISLLAFGSTQEERYTSGRSGGSLGEGAGGAVLGQLINQTVTNRASKLFGVSAIRINPALGGPDNNPSARLTIEQQVSNNVTLTYITNLTQSAQQVIQFEYNINTEYTVQGIRDENGVVSFDLLIRKRKK
jgi:translocation and assembly module TamB